MIYYLWQYTDFMHNECQAIMAKTNDGQVLGIPADEGNADYREYLAWVAEGNVAEPWQPEEPVTEDAN
jgi:hypothetical protein